MSFIFEGLIGCSITLALLYALLAIHTGYRLKWLQTHSSAGLNTRKLLVMTLLLTAILRAMSFASMVLLDLEQVDYQIDSSPDKHLTTNDDTSRTYEFFEKSSLVLFDFPDFSVMSAYMLLFIVWAEAYLKSRRHWLSALRFRRVWMLSYFVFNILLYSTQVGLYSLLFIPAVDEYVQLNLIYLTLSVLSFLLPLAWALGYLYLAIMFSGFPFSTLAAKIRLGYLSNLSALWTFSRIVWGFMALTTVLQGWLTEAKKSKLFYSIVLVVVFLVAEIIPIWFTLQPHIIQSLSEEPLQNVSDGPVTPWQFRERVKSEDGVMESDIFAADHLTHLLATPNTHSLTVSSSASTLNTSSAVVNPLHSAGRPTVQHDRDLRERERERQRQRSREIEDGESEEKLDWPTPRQASGLSSSFGEHASFVTATSERDNRQQQEGFWNGLWTLWS